MKEIQGLQSIGGLGATVLEPSSELLNWNLEALFTGPRAAWASARSLYMHTSSSMFSFINYPSKVFGNFFFSWFRIQSKITHFIALNCHCLLNWTILSFPLCFMTLTFFF